MTSPRADRPARVALVGPTASGKSAVAIAAARELGDVELVSIDAMQVYRGMDIGTAKPSVAEQSEVRHHLVDLVDPTDEFTVVDFQRACANALDDIAARGKRAMLVGGTGLYHRAVVDDLTLPGEWPAIREGLLAEAATTGTSALHERLAELDPVAARKMEPSNTRRVVRALEVCIGSGRPFSSFGAGLDTYPATEVAQVGLTWDRDVLAERISARVESMMAAGLLDEVARLHSIGMSRTASQALGYKELIGHLDGRVSLDEATRQIVVRTRQFAVRQLRWFRRDPRVRWVHVTDDPVRSALPVVIDAYR